jgi:hypothetical protein
MKVQNRISFMKRIDKKWELGNNQTCLTQHTRKLLRQIRVKEKNKQYSSQPEKILRNQKISPNNNPKHKRS